MSSRRDYSYEIYFYIFTILKKKIGVKILLMAKVHKLFKTDPLIVTVEIEDV